MSESDQGTLLASSSLFFFFPSTVFTRKGSFLVIFQSQYYFRIVKKRWYMFYSSHCTGSCGENCFTWGHSLAWEMKPWVSTWDKESQIARNREGTHRLPTVQLCVLGELFNFSGAQFLHQLNEGTTKILFMGLFYKSCEYIYIYINKVLKSSAWCTLCICQLLFPRDMCRWQIPLSENQQRILSL